MKIPFTWWVHDDDEGFALMLEELLPKYDIPNVDELVQKVGKPFYEITLKCELDADTGEVTVLEFTP